MIVYLTNDDLKFEKYPVEDCGDGGKYALNYPEKLNSEAGGEGSKTGNSSYTYTATKLTIGGSSKTLKIVLPDDCEFVDAGSDTTDSTTSG